MTIKPTLLDALVSLSPGVSASFNGKNIIWVDPPTPLYTDEELQLELDRLIALQEATEYQRLRAAEYPPAADYLDGVVKGDQAQIDKYVADCLAVKAKYPKPTN